MKQFEKVSGSSIAGNVTVSSTTVSSQLRKLVMGQVVLTTDATAANRNVIIRLTDESDNTVIDVHAGAPVTASKTSQHIEMMQGIYRETSFIDNALQLPIPEEFYVPPFWSLKVIIENGVAGDSYNYNLIFSVEEVTPGQVI